jgi:hypothetical protein
MFGYFQKNFHQAANPERQLVELIKDDIPAARSIYLQNLQGLGLGKLFSKSHL